MSTDPGGGPVDFSLFTCSLPPLIFSLTPLTLHLPPLHFSPLSSRLPSPIILLLDDRPRFLYRGVKRHSSSSSPSSPPIPSCLFFIVHVRTVNQPSPSPPPPSLCFSPSIYLFFLHLLSITSCQLREGTPRGARRVDTEAGKTQSEGL